jgi:hypothetical protein
MGARVELDEPFIAGGLNYEIAHFVQLLQTGQVESPIITHEMSRRMIKMIDDARAIIGLKYIGE